MSPKESEKIGAVYKTERKRLLGYIRNRIPDTAEAEDILQDVFYQLTVGFSDIRRIETVTAWLYKVADNRIIDLFRKKKPVSISYNENAKDGEDGPLTLGEILPSLGSTHEEDEIKEMIWEAIEETLLELPEEQRSVFVLNEFEDMSFKDISEKTGTGINTLISRLSTLADNLYALSDKGKVPVVVTCQWLEENISSADIVILHISTVLRDYENGHIPGAKNMNATDLFDTRTFHFATVEKLKEMFKPLEIPYGARPVFYCNSGNLASVNFVAAVLAGFSPLIYDGSMEEWGSHFDLPVEKEQTAK